jgi:general nucleoside transport system ATP-binding protein
MSDRPEAVRMCGIVKGFPGVMANDHVDFTLHWGEVHALLGENGAGKSTLMNILCGLYSPDDGQIFVDDEAVQFRSPRDALEHGVGMVHQHFMLANKFDVIESISAGLTEPRVVLNPNKMEQEIRALGEKHGLEVDPRAHIWQLSVGEQQRVEILRLLYRGAEILILDEPTAVLTQQEANELFSNLREMVAQRKAVIFISHKLNEVFAVSDRITVLRQGRVVGTKKVEETNKRELARLMVGKELIFDLEKGNLDPGEVVLQVENLYARNDRGLPSLRGVSFEARQSEILGIAGVAGNGQKELAETIMGLHPVQSGAIHIAGERLEKESHKWVIDKAGVNYIPEDRNHTGSVASLSITRNAVLKRYRKEPFSKGLFVNWREAEKFARELINAFQIMPPNPSAHIGLLSGGNVQRLILAREVAGNPPLLVAVHPTYGLDVAATQFVREKLLEQRNKGTAILLISEDLEEIFALSDRVAVIYEGQLMCILDGYEALNNLEAIGLMMAGSKPKAIEGDMR